MTTRVQKGGPIFKPVAKPRARPAGDTRRASISLSQDAYDLVPPTPPQGLSAAIPPPHSHNVSEIHEARQFEAINQTEPSATFSRTLKPPTIQSARALRTSQSNPPSIASSSNLLPAPPIPPVLEKFPISAATKSQPSIMHVPPPPTPSEESVALVAMEDPARALSPPSDPVVENIPSRELDNTQIDPALLEAVVTALQHADRTSVPTSNITGYETISAASGSLPGSQDAPQRHIDAVQVPAGGVVDGDIAITALRPRRKRTKRISPPYRGADDSEPHGPDHSIDSSIAITEKPRKRKRTQSNATSRFEDEDEESEDAPARRRRISPGGGRKPKAPVIPNYDPEADPGDEIDPTSVTMGALCDDQGTGRVSSKAAQIVSNHAAWRSANREKRVRMKAIMEAKKYGRNLEEEEEALASNGPTKESLTSSPEGAPLTTPNGIDPSDPGLSQTLAASNDEQIKKDNFDYSQAMATSRYNVQVRIGPNGETIIDEDSLFVDNNEEDDTSAYTHVEESDATKFINSATYSKKSRGSRWSAEETELFFDALSQFGENYELISFVLPGRDRKACKNKFKAEDRRDSARITYCLKNKRPYDIATLSRMTGKDFSGPIPVIRTPTPISTVETPAPNVDTDTDTATDTAKSASKRKKPSKTISADEEVLGNVSDLEDDSTDLALTRGLHF